MYIRKAEIKDFERIMEIYAYARTYMAEHGNPNQWGATNWPPEKLIQEDIAQKKCHLCIGDREEIIGVFYYDRGTRVESAYDQIESGQWIGDDEYGVVHRVASDGSQRGIGSFCINWAISQCGHIRIDTHGDNKTMQNLLKKLGFTQCGIIYVPEDDDPRLAYEILKQ